mmetsp:Transcript_162430/g.296463  ORF Transcript_162430/g.296463 Transcript_162430/m.296463 type:complete len:274 (+) Transcript_162430:984-1805(+)
MKDAHHALDLSCTRYVLLWLAITFWLCFFPHAWRVEFFSVFVFRRLILDLRASAGRCPKHTEGAHCCACHLARFSNFALCIEFLRCLLRVVDGLPGWQNLHRAAKALQPCSGQGLRVLHRLHCRSCLNFCITEETISCFHDSLTAQTNLKRGMALAWRSQRFCSSARCSFVNFHYIQIGVQLKKLLLHCSSCFLTLRGGLRRGRRTGLGRHGVAGALAAFLGSLFFRGSLSILGLSRILREQAHFGLSALAKPLLPAFLRNSMALVGFPVGAI